MEKFVASGALVVIAAGLAWYAHRTRGRADAYSLYVEATRVSEIAPGTPAFFTGTVGCDTPLQTPFSKQPCVYYSYEIKERRSETDRNGRTRDEWAVVSRDKSGTMFYLDKQGERVYANPQSAQVDGAQSTEQYLEPSQITGMGVAGNVLNALNTMTAEKRLVKEDYIALGANYSVGGVPAQSGAAILFNNDEQYPLVITQKTKADLVKGARRKGLLFYAGSIFALIGAIVTLAKV